MESNDVDETWGRRTAVVVGDCGEIHVHLGQVHALAAPQRPGCNTSTNPPHQSPSSLTPRQYTHIHTQTYADTHVCMSAGKTHMYVYTTWTGIYSMHARIRTVRHGRERQPIDSDPRLPSRRTILGSAEDFDAFDCVDLQGDGAHVDEDDPAHVHNCMHTRA